MASKSQASHTEDVPYNGNDDDNNADMVVSERKAESDDSNDANSEEKADSDNSGRCQRRRNMDKSHW